MSTYAGRSLAKQPGTRVHVEPAHSPTLGITVWIAISTDVAILVHELFHMLEYMQPRGLALVQPCTDLAVNLVPRSPDIAAQVSFQRAEHIGKPFLAVPVVAI